MGIADIEVTTSVDGEAGFITFELSLDEKQVAESIVQVGPKTNSRIYVADC